VFGNLSDRLSQSFRSLRSRGVLTESDVDHAISDIRRALIAAAPRQIDGTDVIEQGTLAAENVLEALKDVIDPELGINVVDLGLVYSIWIENGVDAHIEMTLTSPACPLTDVLEEQAQEAVVGSGVVENLTLDWVWMPPWGPNMITEEGREQLRALGFNV